MIYFQDKDHKYFSEVGEKYTSVSDLYSRYKPPYERDFWLDHGILKEMIPNFKELKKKFSSEKEAVRLLKEDILRTNPEEFEKRREKLAATWTRDNANAIRTGNLYHKDSEKMAYIRKAMVNPFTGVASKVVELPRHEKYDNYSVKKSLYDLEDGFYPELLLWNDDYRIAGQSDKVFITTIKDTRYVDVDDYKTNKKISTKGFRGQKMLPPLSHLDDCHLIHYSLAISLYAWMLERAGYTVRNLGFHHYNILYPIEYLKPEVEKILNLHIERIKYI